VRDADETAADDAMNGKSGDETDTDDSEEYGCVYCDETFESEDDHNQHFGQCSENPVNRDDETDEPDIEPPDVDGQSKWTDWE